MAKAVESVGWSTKARRASVAKLDDVIVVYTISTSKKGWGISVPPFRVLNIDTSPSQILDAILEVLPFSNDRWPPPKGLSEDAKPLLRAMKLRSWDDFEPIADVEVSQEIDGGRFQMMAMKRAKRRGNAEPVNNRYITFPGDAPKELMAKKLASAMRQSEKAYGPKKK